MIVEKKVRNCLVSRVTDPNGVQIGVAELSDELEEEEEGERDRLTSGPRRPSRINTAAARNENEARRGLGKVGWRQKHKKRKPILSSRPVLYCPTNHRASSRSC
tara:strand:+ start:568 stop:879 length:312 start_codon:yes stop_codon:yes gene_type:complete